MLQPRGLTEASNHCIEGRLHSGDVTFARSDGNLTYMVCVAPERDLLIAKTHSMYERMLLYMLYLCCVTGTDPAVLRTEAVALA
jgi:hypothetical protein